MTHPTLLDLLLGRAPGAGAPLAGAAADPRVREALAACLDAPLWVDAVLSGAPYSDVEHLLERADAAARALPPEAVLAALRTHPRIGERPAGEGASARMSRLEQSGVADDEATRAELAAANAAYEERFGHVFLIRAAGLSREEVLVALRRRLAHDPAVELSVAADQLRQIALLRLEASLLATVGHVAEPAPASEPGRDGAESGVAAP